MGLVKLGDSYDDALAKIERCEKATGERADASISIEEIITGKDNFFIHAEYSEVISKLNNMLARSSENVQTVIGEPVQSTIEPVPKQRSMDTSNAEKQIMELVQGIEKDVIRMGKGFGGRGPPAPQAQEAPKVANVQPVQVQATETPQANQVEAAGNAPEKPAPHLDLGKFVGDVGGEMDKAMATTVSSEESLGSDRLTSLSIPDQIAELEKISLDIYEKKDSEEEIRKAKAELDALSASLKNEKTENASDFEKRLIELRNERLKEAISLAGGQTA